MRPPVLVGTIGATNLVEWNDRVWVVPQSLGPLDIDKDEHRRRPGIVEHPDLVSARRALGVASPAAPAHVPAEAGRWPVTWWRYTGDMGPWRDRDGNPCDEVGARSRSPILICDATGETAESNKLPFGACYAVPEDVVAYYQTGHDGLSIVCICPSSYGPTQWHIDGYANNCTSPCKVCGQQRRAHHEKDLGHRYEDANPEHRCWVRRGTVGEPIHVDKNGNTCQAGGGSIQTDGWHGHLHNGLLYTS